MNWGKWIVIVFLMFAVFIGVLVYYCVREDISLVTPEYYREELAFQDQIDRLKNTEALDQKPRLTVVSSGLMISFRQLPFFDVGEIQLFRPSDKRFDRKFNFTVK